jgi:L-lactate dehydrogenase complex protein LldG
LDDLMRDFEEEFRGVGGKPYRAHDFHELEGTLMSILEGPSDRGIVLSANPILQKLRVCSRLQSRYTNCIDLGQQSGSPSDPDTMKACFEARFGLTGVDFVLAETGTLVVTSRTERSQLASLAPPVHIALYRPEQIVASLEEILEWMASQDANHRAPPGRSVVLITGPSRTGDIEMTLTIGVHGPQEIHAILVEDGCFSG